VGLSDDQKAMLRLLAQRGEQGYEDIAALKGLSVEEVDAQARKAISVLEEEGIPAPSIPPPPGGRVDEDAPAQPPPPVAESAEPDPEPPPPAPAPPAKDDPAAAAAKPKAKPEPATPGGRKRSTTPPKLSLPSGKGARVAIAAGIGVIVVVVVILLVSGGGGDSSSTTGAASEASKGSVVAIALKKAEGEKSNGKQAPTYAPLRPTEGDEGLGIAIFGKVKKALALRVVVEGLEQTGDGESYAIWLSDGPKKMLPLASTEVTEKGTINAQVEVPLEVLAYLASETFDEIAVTRISNSQLKASLNSATKAKKAPAYTGTEVLRGQVVGPIVGAKQRIQEEEAGEAKK
jgi:hypothetical protein